MLCSQQEQETIREEVEVVNVQLPVWVFHKKKPVKGLDKKDFELFVNGKERAVNAFYEMRKKIQPKPGRHEPRLFVLVFNISSYDDRLRNGLETFFEKLIRPGDRIMVLANNTFLADRLIEDRARELEKIKNLLELESLRINQALASLEFNMRYLVRTFKFELNSTTQGQDRIIMRFLLDNLRMMREFRKHFFNPEPGTYLKVTDYIKKQQMEKWVLYFFQTPRFPQMNPMSNMYKQIENIASADDVLKGYLQDYREGFSMPDNTRVEEMSKLFLNTGAGFHTLLLSTMLDTSVEGFSFQSVAVDSEFVSRQVTKWTGGKILFNADMEKFVKKISDREDVYYMLSYVPDKSDEKGQIKVRLPAHRRYRVVYDDLQRPSDLDVQKLRPAKRQIDIDSLKVEQGMIYASLSGIEMKPRKDDTNAGNILFNITILNEKAQSVGTVKKGFVCKDEKVPLGMHMPELQAGEYRVMLEVSDTNSGSSDIEFYKFSLPEDLVLKDGAVPFQFVAQPVLRSVPYNEELKKDFIPDASPEEAADPSLLPVILLKVSDYCIRLKATLLNFFCIEDIHEEVYDVFAWRSGAKKGKSKTNRLTYGYQLSNIKGETHEKRVLFDKNGQEMVKNNAPLETRFRYTNIVFVPFMLGQRSQAYYHYRLLGRKLHKERNVLIIEAIPKPGIKDQVVAGQFWVDEADFSVVRIVVYQNSLKNYDQIKNMAQKQHVKPQITIIHEYDIVKKGVRFPSKLYYEEAYKDNRGNMHVQTMGNVTFKDYKFFTIETRVTQDKM